MLCSGSSPEVTSLVTRLKALAAQKEEQSILQSQVDVKKEKVSVSLPNSPREPGSTFTSTMTTATTTKAKVVANNMCAF